MTCIMGVARDNRVHIAGDSAAVSSYDLVIRKDPKVFRNGEFIMGYTTSFRMGQLLRFAFKTPQQKEGQTDYEYLCTDFIDSVRTCLASGGFKNVDKNVETGGQFLLGYRGVIYHIDQDFQVGIPLDQIAACGCGSELGIGAVTALLRYLNPRAALFEALEIVERNSTCVRSPFIIESIGGLNEVT